MTPLAYAALLGWPLVVIVLYATVPGRRAATIALIGAWLLLPPAGISIAGLPDYTKNVAATLGMLAGALLFDSGRLLAFRPRWFDLPMLAWCLTGIPSSLSNELGWYEAFADTFNQVVIWGLPYWLGRVYFGTPEDLRELAVGMAIGGIAYTLPCLWESRMSPQLLLQFYGISDVGMIYMRMGGYRPHVFFYTGLECGMWMTAASLSAWWLWYRGGLRSIAGYPLGPPLLLLLATTVLCRATGALALLLAGIGLLWLSDRLRTRLLLAGLLLVGPVYSGVRLPEIWSGRQAVDLAEAIVGPARAQSLEYRFLCERMLGDHALQRPIFGWGGFGRNLVFFDEGRSQNVPPDGLWIVTMGVRGYVGLVLLYLVFALPAALFVHRFPARSWGDPRLAAAVLAATFLGLYIVDCLLNAFVNIIYITLAGGLAGLDPRQLRARTPAGAAAAGRRADGRAARVDPAAADRALSADRCRALGRSLRRDGRPDEADAAWWQALDLIAGWIEADPVAVEPRRRWCDCANDLAWLRANHPDPARRDPASAVALARRAVEEFPDAAAYWNTLGAAHYRDGDPHAAVAALGRARDLAGGTAFDEVFLAMAYARAGEPGAARQAMARALLRAGRDHPGHAELAALCDEARALVDADAPTAAG